MCLAIAGQYRPPATSHEFCAPATTETAIKFETVFRQSTKWYTILVYCISSVGRDNSVGIATRYGLDVRGSNHGGSQIFRIRPDRTTQPRVQWAPGLSRGKSGRDLALTTHRI